MPYICIGICKCCPQTVVCVCVRVRVRAQEKREQEMLTEIKPPGPAQVVAVSAALQAVFTEQGLTDEDTMRRQDVVSSMQELLLAVLPGKPRPSRPVCVCTALGQSDRLYIYDTPLTLA